MVNQLVRKRNKIPRHVSRYPAKMVLTLANQIKERYIEANDHNICDPFCGSGEILKSFDSNNKSLFGVDLNPVGILFSYIKLNNFNYSEALKCCQEIIACAKSSNESLNTSYDNISYWFTPKALEKLLKLRYWLHRNNKNETPEFKAILLSFMLSIRLCSKSDQKSPKPFISKLAKSKRKGKHYDPYSIILLILEDLNHFYNTSRDTHNQLQLYLGNFTDVAKSELEQYSMDAIITSPPYLNAQDYFRNYKLELFLLENILPFQVENIKPLFIGTERGDLIQKIPDNNIDLYKNIIPEAMEIEIHNKRLSNVLLRYYYDMHCSIKAMKHVLKPSGKVIMVCGDNLICGIQVKTWLGINRLLELEGFCLYDQFDDTIKNRMLPPKRNGHKSIIKEEVVSAFRFG